MTTQKQPGTAATISLETLHEVVETLAPLDRTPCSIGELIAAEWLVDRFRAAGCDDVVLETEPSWGTFPPTVIATGVIGLVGGVAALCGRRAIGTLLATLAALGVVDEAQNGPRVLRKLLKQKLETVNVVARVGDPNASHTLLMLAHHDAPQTGAIFDQSLVRKIHARWPEFIESRKASPPQWWLGLAAPVLCAVGALTGRRRLTKTGFALGLVGTGLVADIHRSPTVPGANDNLSGVAALVAIAEALRDNPIDGVNVWLVSCGAEETMQDGIRAFIARHGSELRASNACALNFDTVGSPNLCMLEGEGPIWMEKYCGPEFRDLIERAANDNAIALERGLSARSSTDSVITSRAQLPTTCLVSLNEWRGLSNYHLMTDTPENLDYATVAEAARLGYATAVAISQS